MFYLPFIGIVLSLAGIGYLVLRAWPRVKALPPETVPPEMGARALRERLTQYWRRAQPVLMAFVARLLHRSRLMALKTDNRLSRWIESVRNRSRLVSFRPRAWFLDRAANRQDTPRISFAELVEGQLKAREEELLKRVKETPKEPVLYTELAELYEKMGNLEDAKEARLTAEKLTKRKTKKAGGLA